jgi:predicted dehydrogenase
LAAKQNASAGNFPFEAVPFNMLPSAIQFTENIMRSFSFLIPVFVLFALAYSHGQASVQTTAPLRVGIVGLVHGHVQGFLDHSLHSSLIEIVGIAEPDEKLASQYAAHYGFDHSLLFSKLEQMLDRTHPQAVLVYTNTYDHHRVVEVCARRGVHVMMEKPLAVSLDDALAMKRAADLGKIQVLVNYETTWYASNRAAYDLVHEHALGDVRKVVVHDGHSGPKEINVEPEFLAWLTDPKLDGGGALFDFGCYGADLMTWLMDGKRPETVTASRNRSNPRFTSTWMMKPPSFSLIRRRKPSCKHLGIGLSTARTWKCTARLDM